MTAGTVAAIRCDGQLTVGLVLALASLRGPRMQREGTRGLPLQDPARAGDAVSGSRLLDAAVCSTAESGEPPAHRSLSSPRAGAARRPRGRTRGTARREGEGRVPAPPPCLLPSLTCRPGAARAPRSAAATSQRGRSTIPSRPPAPRPRPRSARSLLLPLPSLRPAAAAGPGPAGRAERRRVPRAACCLSLIHI